MAFFCELWKFPDSIQNLAGKYNQELGASVDFHAMLNIGSLDHTSNSDALKFGADAMKARHTLEDEASCMASFKMKVPALFGVDLSNAASTEDSQVLARRRKNGIWGWLCRSQVCLNNKSRGCEIKASAECQQ